jgi:hypothetical protein
MKKMIVLSFALLIASLGFAQDQSPQPSAQSPNSTATSSSTPTAGSIQGCLGGSDGNFTLTQDSTGTIFKLVGSNDRLKQHVGHEVAVSGQTSGDTGSAASAQGSPSSGATDATASGSTIQVSDVKMVSTQCSSSSNTPQH